MSDDNYADMLKAEKHAEQVLKANNYREQCLKCCSTCDNAGRLTVEDPLICDLTKPDCWEFGIVDELGLCDKYVPKVVDK